MTLSIGQLASAAGLSASAIRYYEAEGLLPRPSRNGHRRVYDAADLERVRMVCMARRLGFTIADLRALAQVEGGGADRAVWRRRIAVKIEQIDRSLADLNLARAKLASISDCGCPQLSRCDLMNA